MLTQVTDLVLEDMLDGTIRRKSFYEKRECKDSFRCEYEAVLKALADHQELLNKQGEELEMLMDSQTVQKQLNRQYGMNDDDTREIADSWEECAFSLDP